MNNLIGNDFPHVDLPVPYLAWSDVTGEILDTYGSFPCKIQAGIFALCVSGSVRVAINLAEHIIQPHDFIFLVPGTFIEVRATAPDTHIAFVGFSSAFMHNVELQNLAAEFFTLLISNPIIPLPDNVYPLYQETFNLVSRMLNTPGVTIGPRIMIPLMNIFIECVSARQENRNTQSGVETRDRIIFREFMKQAFIHYRKEHKVSFYARAAGLTLSHFCAAVTKASGKKAHEIIINLIIMDAKGQLGGSNVRINEVAESLGFENATTFTRFFREYVGMTPLQYRNSL